MSDLTCRQCGAQVHDGKTCAELLFDLICAGPAVDERTCLRAAARYALQHPGTHSKECLDLARGYLDAERTIAPASEEDAAASEPRGGGARSGACAFRSFARRIVRRLGRQALQRLH
jgi:hypothetical protein